MKNKLRIVHGTTDHGHAERLDCLTCLDVEIEYLQALRKAGGKTEFIETLELDPSICGHCGEPVEIRNNSGYCDHLYYPENCDYCRTKKMKKENLTPIICDHCGKEVERWKACSCCEEK